MNHPFRFICGVLAAWTLAWCGMVLAPQFQIGRQSLITLPDTGQSYPAARSGRAGRGRELYRSLGCAACHTQQVRPADVPRWGRRPTVAQDYLYDQPVLPGSRRMGPDLSNLALRRPSADWHLLHLYQPGLAVPGSIMPPVRHLFETRELRRTKSRDALPLPKEASPGDGREIIPTSGALDLAAYLQSLRMDAPLFEAPLPAPRRAVPAVLPQGGRP